MRIHVSYPLHNNRWQGFYLTASRTCAQHRRPPVSNVPSFDVHSTHVCLSWWLMSRMQHLCVSPFNSQSSISMENSGPANDKSEIQTQEPIHGLLSKQGRPIVNQLAKYLEKQRGEAKLWNLSMLTTEGVSWFWTPLSFLEQILHLIFLCSELEAWPTNFHWVHEFIQLSKIFHTIFYWVPKVKCIRGVCREFVRHAQSIVSVAMSQLSVYLQSVVAIQGTNIPRISSRKSSLFLL